MRKYFYDPIWDWVYFYETTLRIDSFDLLHIIRAFHDHFWIRESFYQRAYFVQYGNSQINNL